MTKTSFQDIINSDIPVLIDFYADWCGPCRMVTPILNEIKNELGEQVKIVKIDVDRNQAIAQKLDVRSIPTLMIYQHGELKWRVAGVQSKSVIVNQLQSLMTEA
ncbi:MAG TPA: thioredoxin [Saprospiraceae bacterium]|nr:thioredoxin [Saprospiraceae bacterium]